jgi:hypothetical protein
MSFPSLLLEIRRAVANSKVIQETNTIESYGGLHNNLKSVLRQAGHEKSKSKESTKNVKWKF